MQSIRRAILAAMVIFSIAGCSLFAVTQAPENLQARAFALAGVHDLETGDLPGLQARMAPELRAQIASKMEELRPLLPDSPSTPPRVVFSESNDLTQSGQTVHFDRYTIEIAGRTGWAFVRCQVMTRAGDLRLNAFYVQKMGMSYADYTGFSLSDLTLAKVLIVLVGLIGLGLTITAWVVLYRSLAFARKWPWGIAIAFSVMQINLRWIDGAWGINPLSFQVLQPGAVRMGDQPWIITVAIPVFAIAVLFYDWRYRHRPEAVWE